MRHWFMLTVVGKDQPGIVAAVTRALVEAGANLGEASMVRLGGNFTVMLMIDADCEEAVLRRHLEPTVRRLELHAHLDIIDGRLHEHVAPTVRIIVHGADRPGIVAQVTAELAAAGVNILDLDSDVAGTRDRPIYVMVIDGHVPGDIRVLDKRLEALRQGGIEVRTAPIDTMLG